MLTNALRHGDGSSVEIELWYEETLVSLTARNGIPPAQSAQSVSRNAIAERRGSARGLAGIRTRAAIFDGSISYGPDSAGRFWETTVVFPIDGDR